MNKMTNGKWAPFPAVWAFLAWTLTIASTCVCSFVTRKVSLRGISEDDLDNQGVLLFESHGIGFWGWEYEGKCYNFEVEGRHPSFDGMYKAASAFTTTTDVVGGLLLICFVLGTCFPIQPNRYEIMGYVTLLVAVLDGATLIILGSSVCSNRFFDYATPDISLSEFASTSCGMASGSVLALLSSIIWLIAAGFCLRTPLSDKTREPKESTRGASPELPQRSEHDPDDEAHRLYHQRREETERQYREMFGDDDSTSNSDRVAPFQSIRQDKLSLVPEESDHDPNISGHSSLKKSNDASDDGGGDHDEQSYDDDDAYEAYEEQQRDVESYDDEFHDGHEDIQSHRSSYYDDDEATTRYDDDDRSRVSDYRSRASHRNPGDDDSHNSSKRSSYRSRGMTGHDDEELISLTNSEIA
eukprot:CAMPEP_0116579180 /NCGR_PEP_ID=MMETSP0397-20121206/22114_1 /TAXON_ID=216820 /ORGANISM="Cyclophora tenuis, Strain ECT3854" /LENGTH=411 /DNA_ID=CAMNT_0004108643 /DNA_START=204 /DNA_END=1439 /DNA_ORIENTATION=-